MVKKQKTPFIFKLSVFVFIISLVIIAISFENELFADFINQGASSFLRSFLSLLSSPFEHSIFEIIVIISPLIFAFLLFYIFLSGKNLTKLKKRFLSVLSFFVLAASLYVFTVGIPFVCRGFSSRISIDDDITNDDLMYSAEVLIKEIENYSENEDKNYKAPDIESALRSSLYSPPKFIPMLSLKKGELSKVYSKLGIYSFYSFLTGEVILNTEIPDYMTPFVIAHEYSHALGAAGEADAEFSAYIALSESDVPYLRYSAAMCALEYVYASLSESNRQKIYQSLPPSAKTDFLIHKSYRQKNDGTPSKIGAEINGAVNFAYGKDKNYSSFLKMLVGYLNGNS